MKPSIGTILRMMKFIRTCHRRMAEHHPEDEFLECMYEVSEAYYVCMRSFIRKEKEVPYYEGLQNSPLPKQFLIL